MTASRQALARAVRGLDGALAAFARASAPAPASAEALACWDSVARALKLESWLHEAGKEEADQLRRPLLSKVLTFPLTLARGSRSEWSAGAAPLLRAHVLGARAESTLPAQYWQVLAQVTGCQWELHFVGPQTQRSPPGTTAPGDVALRSSRGLYHQVRADLDEPDVFVLFNSGLGHPREGESWRATLDLILGQSPARPVLLTSFNEGDFERDMAALSARGVQPSVREPLQPLRSLMKERGDSSEGAVFYNYAFSRLN